MANATVTTRAALFARPPEPGRVKTRLSPALPPREACTLYRGMLADALRALEASSASETYVYWSDAPSQPATPSGASFRTRIQRGKDLGARLTGAFTELLDKPGDRALVIGADCPAVDAAVIDGAFEALAMADVVLGPTVDGGYYLVGLSRREPSLFEAIEWGTEHVLAQTLARTRSAGLEVAVLATLEDVDTPADLVRLLARAAWDRGSEPASAPETRAALRELGLLP